MPKTRSVVTLGTFDGVHKGHQALLKRVAMRAKTLGARSVALSFGMPPRHTGDPVRPVLLTTLDEKRRLLRRFGIQKSDILVFNRLTASTPPETFFTQTIVKKHQAAEMVVGPRVAFGRKRAGRLPLLRQLGQQHDVAIHVVPVIAGPRGPVSSRRIRSLITKGHVEQANALLGYPYSAAGKVVSGDRRGRRLGFPTANIDVPPSKLLPRGVFWVKVLPESAAPVTAQETRQGLDGLCNVGVRPTFTPQSHTLHCEVYIFGAAGRRKQIRYRLYGKSLRVVFLRRIRPERRFASPEALTRRIARDLETALLYRKSQFSI